MLLPGAGRGRQPRGTRTDDSSAAETRSLDCHSAEDEEEALEEAGYSGQKAPIAVVWCEGMSPVQAHLLGVNTFLLWYDAKEHTKNDPGQGHSGHYSETTCVTSA